MLITCPPMLHAMDQFRGMFGEKKVEVECPNVVQALSEEELIALVPDFDGWIIGDDPATRRVFAAGKEGRLRACVKWGVGLDNVDVAAAEALHVAVTNTPGVFGADVAD